MPYSKQQLASALDSRDKALVVLANMRKQREKQVQTALKALPADADKERQLQAYDDLKKQWFDKLKSDLERCYIQQDVKKFLPRLLAETERDQPTSCLWLRQKCKLLKQQQQQEAPRTSQACTQTSQRDAQRLLIASVINPSTKTQHGSHKDDMTNPNTTQAPYSTPQLQQDPSTKRMQDKKGQPSSEQGQQQSQQPPVASCWLWSLFGRRRRQGAC